ncbi:MAG: hypothetical protein ACRDRA_00705 [Pseudonocardiaceae bacterium]
MAGRFIHHQPTEFELSAESAITLAPTIEAIQAAGFQADPARSPVIPSSAVRRWQAAIDTDLATFAVDVLGLGDTCAAPRPCPSRVLVKSGPAVGWFTSYAPACTSVTP